MHVLSKKRLREFWQRHADAELSLLRWHKLVSKAHYRDFNALRADFPSADWVEGLVVFNIGGNKYRLVADVRFDRALVFVKVVLTHREYDKGAWKK
jgi:mRNA interferase HigB